MFSNQAPIEGPISIDNAIARSIKYNLDSRVSILEEALQNNQWDLAIWDMFPEITAHGEIKRRSNKDKSTSHSQTTGRGETASYSEHQTVREADLSVSLNILDFGVSYFSAKQQADRSLIMEERRRKVAQKIANEVRGIFFKGLWGFAFGQAFSGSPMGHP